jgi:hypothetical protein
MSQQLHPSGVMLFLNNLYLKLDALLEEHVGGRKLAASSTLFAGLVDAMPFMHNLSLTHP